MAILSAALADADRALKDAREIGHAPTLMIALANMTHILCGNYATANAACDELVALADEKGALWWKALGTCLQGYVFALTGKASNAVLTINGTDRSMAVNGIDSVCSVAFVIFDDSLCRTRSTR